ncbi:MAG TPA: PAS domain-containing protein [Moorella mulderi]|nr:PAS domain-containing protein [Moorella mulderi]
MLEHLNEAICVINRERKVIYWNQKAEELYGIK